MVRRDEAGREPLKGEGPVSRCECPAGESPVRVTVGGPGSRPQAGGESLPARAGCREPLRGEPVRGPQRQVKLAASSHKQSGRRAAHFTAKTTSSAPAPKRAGEPGGVGGAARGHGHSRNARDPSARPSSGQGAAYKPMAKSPVEQRESEGIVVPSNVATNNATGGKDPCGGCVEGAGKRKGMDGLTVPNSPRRRRPLDNVRQLQRRLWAAAKRSPGRRFHALYDRIFRRDVLEEAWKRVKRNRGSSGVDSVTLAEVEVYGVERLLEELAAELRDGTYQPLPARRVYLPKPDGKKRPLGIPAVRDRVVQMATKLVLEPIFEAGFLPCSFGFRPKRGATQALEMLRRQGAQCNHALDADIRDFFGSIDHGKLMKLLERRVSDRRVLKLLKKWLEAGVMEEGRWHETTTGAPQGAVISPLLSNIFLHVFDLLWERHGKGIGVLVRYADDFVILCRSGRDCEQAEAKVREIFARLGLELHPDKTRRVDLSRGRQGFDFLGCHLRKRMSGPIWERERRHVYFLHRWPSAKSMKRVRQRIREETARSRQGARDVREVIERINPVLRGWGSYFQTGNAAQKFNQVDRYALDRLKRFLLTRKGRNLRPGDVLKWDRSFFESHGLHRLRGTVKYPGAA